MNTLRSISTAVLLSLVLATSASAAEPNISVTVSANPSATLGTPVTYNVSGEGEARQTFSVRIMSLATYPASECLRANEKSSVVYEYPATLNGSGVSLHSFSESGTIVSSDYSALGAYVVCARITGGVHPAETSVSFSVVAPAPVVTTPAANPNPAPAPSVAPLLPTPVATPSVVASTSAQKLHAALAKCKKQKNKKKKRAQCERAAKHHR